MSAIGTYLEVDADAFIEGQDPRGLVMSFFRHPERISIRDIRVATAGEFAEGLDWRECMAEATDCMKRAGKVEDSGGAEYHMRRAMDYIEIAISRRRR